MLPLNKTLSTECYLEISIDCELSFVLCIAVYSYVVAAA